MEKEIRSNLSEKDRVALEIGQLSQIGIAWEALADEREKRIEEVERENDNLVEKLHRAKEKDLGREKDNEILYNSMKEFEKRGNELLKDNDALLEENRSLKESLQEIEEKALKEKKENLFQRYEIPVEKRLREVRRKGDVWCLCYKIDQQQGNMFGERSWKSKREAVKELSSWCSEEGGWIGTEEFIEEEAEECPICEESPDRRAWTIPCPHCNREVEVSFPLEEIEALKEIESLEKIKPKKMRAVYLQYGRGIHYVCKFLNEYRTVLETNDDGTASVVNICFGIENRFDTEEEAQACLDSGAKSCGWKLHKYI